MIKKKTIKKFITLIHKELELLLIQKGMIEGEILSLQNDLNSLQESYENEKQFARQNSMNFLNFAVYTQNELQKKQTKEIEISSKQNELCELREIIVEKNIEQKKYEHLLENALQEERLLQDKQEMQAIDAFAIYNAYIKNNKQ